MLVFALCFYVDLIPLIRTLEMLLLDAGEEGLNSFGCIGNGRGLLEGAALSRESVARKKF